ncbi:uncharacterized protein LOC112272019 [Brachypodium distachyon]|uniref:uncharacterized protein LOC112272019 n=1 Tax=Brachypodium distachyon TaxID=15368 RepID=UPI000D0E3184|nr:uncharacterized protein LOC112272019 [Brachypodium distachyon]|eukprot:XP_024318278.1 uncharacterized protein LOC112272019 [Brachypodium distachyon]
MAPAVPAKKPRPATSGSGGDAGADAGTAATSVAGDEHIPSQDQQGTGPGTEPDTVDSSAEAEAFWAGVALGQAPSRESADGGGGEGEEAARATEDAPGGAAQTAQHEVPLRHSRFFLLFLPMALIFFVSSGTRM